MQNKTTMSVYEMGCLLGLKKTDSYWLVHKQYFKTILIHGVMRVDIESFEKWYANQIKYKKVNGPLPGKELREYSYSIPEMANLLGISVTVAYDLIKRESIETFKVGTWMRIRKDIFDIWYKSQSKYRTTDDRAKDATIIAASISMPQMAKMLGISRDDVYALLAKKSNKNKFDIVVVANQKRITLESFEKWYQQQEKYQNLSEKAPALSQESQKLENSQRDSLLSSARDSFTPREAALIIGVSQREIYRMIEDELLDSFIIGKRIRIPRSALNWWLNSQVDTFGKEEA